MVLILNEADVDALLDMQSTITTLEAAFREQSAGRILLPNRQVIQEPGSQAIVRIMPASASKLKALGLKVLLGSAGKRRQGATYFAILLFDHDDASLLAIISAGRLTQLRTGGASAVATKHLARSSAHTIGVVGTGVQGYGQLEGVAAVTHPTKCLVYDVSETSIRMMIEKARTKLGIELKQASSLDELCGVDVLCTSTTSTEPIIFWEKLQPGIHINAIGSNVPNRRELHPTVLLNSKVFVDRKEQALNESGDLIIAIKDGIFNPDNIKGEICDVLTKKIPGRTSDSDVTLFKSVGIAIEDVAVARAVYDNAMKKGAGKDLPL